MVDTAKMRRPSFLEELDNPTGHVAHDDRGNAIWQWAPDVVSEPARFAPGFEINDDASDSRIESMNTGLYMQVSNRGGYNPYESGLMQQPHATAAPRKRDLRALSKWIEERRLRGEPTKL